MFEELDGHLFGHADAAVGGGEAGEESGMHANAVVEAEEVGHGGVDEDFAGTSFVFAGVGVFVDDLSGGNVFDDAVGGGFVIDVFLGDLEAAGRGDVGGVAGGDGGDADEFAAFIEVGFLVVAVDADERGAVDAVAIPEAGGFGGVAESGPGSDAEAGEVGAVGGADAGDAGDAGAGGEEGGEEAEREKDAEGHCGG